MSLTFVARTLRAKNLPFWTVRTNVFQTVYAQIRIQT